MVAQSGTEINHVNRIFQRHARLMRGFGGDTELFRYALISALDELAAVTQRDDYALDEQLAAIERVLESHDSELFADVASGRTPLATAIDALIATERAAFAALAEDIMRANADRVDLRSQLAQLDADNTSLTQELATLRSYVTTPHGNGKSSVASVEAQMLAALDASEDRRIREDLSTIANDYCIGLDAGRWTWRDVPRSVRLELVRFVIAGTERHTQSEFDANRPDWMSTASSHVQVFGVPWSHLSDLTREVAA